MHGPWLKPRQAEASQPYPDGVDMHCYAKTARNLFLQVNATPTHDAILGRVRALHDQVA